MRCNKYWNQRDEGT